MAGVLLALSCAAVRAEDVLGGALEPQSESWAGGIATRHGYALYTGVTWAPTGSIRDDGFRLRASGGKGVYRYGSGASRTWGEVSFGDLLAGYHAQIGSATIKGFAGIAGDGHVTDPHDPGYALDGAAIGLKLAFEGWFDLTAAVWSAVDLSWSKAHSTYATRGRIGWRVLPALSLGVEAAAFGNVEGDGGRSGAFARFEWAGGEVSATGGYTGSSVRTPDAPFGAVNVTVRF